MWLVVRQTQPILLLPFIVCMPSFSSEGPRLKKKKKKKKKKIIIFLPDMNTGRCMAKNMLFIVFFFVFFFVII